MTSIHQQRGIKLPRLQHVSLPVPADVHEEIRAFYCGILGFEEKTIPQSLIHLQVLWFAVGDDEMELHLVPDPTHLADPTASRHICFEVPDLDAYRKALVQRGCEIFEADLIPFRPRFFCLDPFGNRLEFTTIEGDYQDAQPED